MAKININQLLVQNSLSSELNAKLVLWQSRRDELAELAAEYQAMAEDELFLENEYYQLQMNMVEQEFYKKQSDFHREGQFLRIIFAHPLYVN